VVVTYFVHREKVTQENSLLEHTVGLFNPTNCACNHVGWKITKEAMSGGVRNVWNNIKMLSAKWRREVSSVNMVLDIAVACCRKKEFYYQLTAPTKERLYHGVRQ
jgi:hypothetical protein